MIRFAALLLGLALAVLAAAAGAQTETRTPFEPVVVVNDAVVTFYDLDQRMRLLVLNGAPQGPQLRDIALDQLIEDRLKREVARARGVDPDAGALAEAAADYAGQRSLTVAQLEAALARARVDRATLDEALGAQLGWIAAVRQRFGARADVTEVEIDQELAAGAGAGAEAYRIGEIAMPFSARGEEATLAFARDLVTQLRGGADFAAAARRHSAAPSAREGGVIGWVQAASLPASVATVLAGLAPGDVSDPIEAPEGVAIVKLLDIRGGAADPGSPEAREALRRQLRSQRLTRFANGWMQELLRDAVIERR
jgi:peptidyl-prolyl cis-trans isomerase SurA